MLSNSPSTAQSPSTSISNKFFPPSSHAIQSPTTPSPLSNSRSINAPLRPQHHPVANFKTASPGANSLITAFTVANPLVTNSSVPPIASLPQVATPQIQSTPQVPFIQSPLPHLSLTLPQLPLANAMQPSLHSVPLTPQLLNALVSQVDSSVITTAPQLQPILRAQLLALQQQAQQLRPPNLQSLRTIRPAVTNPSTTITSASKLYATSNAHIIVNNSGNPILTSNSHITLVSSSITNPPVIPQQALTNNTMPSSNTSIVSSTFSPNVGSVIPHSTSIPPTNTSPVLFGQSASVPSLMNTSDDVIVINDSFDELDKENKHTDSLKEGNGLPADSLHRPINESDGMNSESPVETAATAVDKDQSPTNSEESMLPDSSGLPSIVKDESVSSDSSSCVKQDSGGDSKMKRNKRAASRTGKKPLAKRSKKQNQSSEKVNSSFT